MMIDPPIDKLIKKTDCRYALVCGLSKRARELAALKSPELEESGLKAITYAANEIFEDKVTITVPAVQE